MDSRAVDTPVGKLWLRAADGALHGLDWKEPERSIGNEDSASRAILDQAARQLEAYFAGYLNDFELPVATVGTPFQKRVWMALTAIPFAGTVAYGALARTVGSGARAVANACGANPIAIIVPCHRVIGHAGLGGYSGGDGPATKRALLAHERRFAHSVTAPTPAATVPGHPTAGAITS